MDLKSTVLEYNNCKALQFIDATGTFTAIKDTSATPSKWVVVNDGWYEADITNDQYWTTGTDPAPVINPKISVFDITSLDGAADTYGLKLDISLRTTSVDLVFDYIDLYKNKFPEGGYNFNSISDLVFDIRPSDLKIAKINDVTATSSDQISLDKYLGTDVLPDGVYTLTYKVLKNNVTTDNEVGSSTSIAFVSGVVRNKVYRALVNIPIETNNIDLKENNYQEVLYAYTLLRALENSSFVAHIDDLINGLKTLEKFVLVTKCFKHSKRTVND